jgi:hypothetical protein
MARIKSKQPRKRIQKEFDRSIHADLTTEDRLRVFANLIVDRLIEKQQKGMLNQP